MYDLVGKVFYKYLFTILLLILPFFAQSQNNKLLLRIIPVDSVAKVKLSKSKLIYQLKDSATAYKRIHNLINTFKSQGYILANVDSLYSDSMSVNAYIYIGTKVLMNKISLSHIDSKVLKSIGIDRKKIVKKSITFNGFIQIREDIVNYYEDSGYPFVQTFIDSLIPDNESISGVLRVQKNTFVAIDSIVCKGNPLISMKYLYHYISIKKGDAYNQSKIDETINSLDKLAFLSMQKPFEIEFRDNKADIYLYLKNKKANYFNGIIGFASDKEDDGSFSVTGDVSLSLCNNFKIGENIDIKWNKYSKNSQNLSLKIQFPYVVILPIGIDFAFALEKYELDYLNIDLYGALSYSFSHKNTIKAYFRQKRTFLIDKDKNQTSFKETYNYTAGLNFIYDATDYILNPHEGIFIDASSGIGFRNVDSTRAELVDFELKLGYFIKLGSITTIALLNKSAAMFGKSAFYENELYKIGGANNLRGVDQKSIYASSYSIFSIEPRLLMGKNSAIYLFADYAWYESKYENRRINDTPLSFGLGININTKAGIFKIDYAMGKQFDNPIRFSDSKVHLGFVARF